MNYIIPLSVLILTIVLFFVPARGRYAQFGVLQGILRVLAALPLLLSGVVLHFFRAADTISIIPPGFPYPALLVKLSGVLEIAGAIGLFIPRLRRTAGFLIALLMVAVFPANIFAAGRTVGGLQMPSIPIRTGMQVLYILLVVVSSFGFPRWHGSKPS
jgi:uncharacterized membrane protein